MFRYRSKPAFFLAGVMLLQTVALLTLLMRKNTYFQSSNRVLQAITPQFQYLGDKYEYNSEDSTEKYQNFRTRGIEIPTLYVATATYKRFSQVAELTRLGQTLRNLRFIFWIVVEDAETPHPHIASLLRRTGVPHFYLAATAPRDFKPPAAMGKGVFNRRAALDWLRREEKDGVVYFADDDNTYDLLLFEQIRHTKRVSVFPVGMIQQFGVSAPVVKNGKVVAFHDAYQAHRKFALDMAGFAVNLSLIHAKPTATFPPYLSTLENGFLTALGVELEDLEPMADNCTQVLVWHTKTIPLVRPNMDNLPPDAHESNLEELYRNLLYFMKVTPATI